MTRMATPFADVIDVLMISAVAERFDFELGDIVILNVPVLCRRPETEGDYGEVRIGEDRRRFEVRCADLNVDGVLVTPRRGDFLQQPEFGNRYVIQATPWRDQLGLVWIFDAWRRDNAL